MKKLSSCSGIIFLLMVFVMVYSANDFKLYQILADINIFLYLTDAVNLSSSRSHFTEDSQ